MSNINHLGINENFPVPGQDNDTQVFRDNFDTIKNSLRIARDEITALEDTTAKLNQDNDFELNVIQNAVVKNVRDRVNNFGNQLLPLQSATSNTITIDYDSGAYQICRLRGNVVFDFLNFPGDARIPPFENSLGKVTLELYGDGTERTIDFSLSGSGALNVRKNQGFPETLTVVSATNPVFVEVWRHSPETFYMNYLGQFS